MYTEQVYMSPAKAQEILDRSTLRNRKPNPKSVLELSRRILEGEWQCSPQGIALDKDNNVVDGQHRLLAIVKADRSVPIRVTYNTPSRTMFVTNSIQIGYGQAGRLMYLLKRSAVLMKRKRI